MTKRRAQMNSERTCPTSPNPCSNSSKSHLDGEDGEDKGLHGCSKRRKKSRQKPDLDKKTGVQPAARNSRFAGPEDVACDFCSGRKLKAVKSCLDCEISYCKPHLKYHDKPTRIKIHKLVDPCKNLQEKISCCSDQQSIGIQCTIDQHRGDETVTAAAERRQKQEQLEGSRLNIQQRIQKREEDVKLLHQQMEHINVSTDEAAKRNKSFAETISTLEKRSLEVEQQLRSQHRTAVSALKEQAEKLEQEIAELKRKDTQLEQQAHTEDILFSHSCPSGSQPKNRTDFFRYWKEITLDPHSVNNTLSLSNDGREVKLTIKYQQVSDHPDRVTGRPRVLSRESFTRRCYWEVESKGRVVIAVAYKKDIRTKNSKEEGFGSDDTSWALCCSSHSFTFWHNNKQTPVSGPWSPKVGVYLDHRAGILSFYSVSQTITLLHRIKTTFTQPLHAGISLYGNVGDYAKFLSCQ